MLLTADFSFNLWRRARGDSGWINVFDFEDWCRLRANTPAEFGILDQRHAVRWNDFLQLCQPRARRQLTGETLLEHADRDECCGGGAGRSSQKCNERTIRRAHEFSSKLQQATALDVGLNGLNALPRDLKLPVLGLRVGEILVQRSQPVTLGLKDL